MVPVSPPPPGGDRNHGPALLAVSLASASVAFLATSLRILARTLVVHQVGWDDFTIVIATIISVWAVAINIKQIENGAGRHSYYLSQPQIIEELRWHAYSQIQLYICTAFAKISVCLFLIRIVNKKPLIRFLYILITALAAMNGAVVIMLVTQCRPLNKVWDRTVKGQCWSVNVVQGFGYSAGVFAVVTDFICSVLPIVFLWNVQIKGRIKVALCVLMGMGLLATAFSILKMALLSQLGAKDQTYTQTTLQISAILEENITIITVNMPLMRPLYGLIDKKVHSSYIHLRSAFKKRLTSKSEYSAQRLGSDASTHGWDLPVPSSTVMKSMHMHFSQVDGKTQTGDLATQRNKNKSQSMSSLV